MKRQVVVHHADHYRSTGYWQSILCPVSRAPPRIPYSGSRSWDRSSCHASITEHEIHPHGQDDDDARSFLACLICIACAGPAPAGTRCTRQMAVQSTPPAHRASHQCLSDGLRLEDRQYIAQCEIRRCRSLSAYQNDHYQRQHGEIRVSIRGKALPEIFFYSSFPITSCAADDRLVHDLYVLRFHVNYLISVPGWYATVL